MHQGWNQPRQQVFVCRIENKPASPQCDGVVVAGAELVPLALRSVLGQGLTILRLQLRVRRKCKGHDRSNQDEIIAPQMNWLMIGPNQQALALLYPAEKKVVSFMEREAPLPGCVGSAPQGAAGFQKTDEIKKRVHGFESDYPDSDF